jgi:hypothetical protein
MILKNIYPGDEFIAPSGKHYVLMCGDRSHFHGIDFDHTRSALAMRLDDYSVHVLPWSMFVEKVPIQYTRILR